MRTLIFNGVTGMYEQVKYKESVTLYFTREFTKGNLKDLKHDDHMEFLNEESALKWVKAITENHRNGQLDYRIISYRIGNKG